MATIGEQAIAIIQKFQTVGSWPLDLSDAPAVLAKVSVMLVPYGSKPAAILNNMHERGFTDVQFEDVQQVREFILTQ